MASLAGQTIKDKYIALLKTADNGDLSANSGASAVNITDGIGTATALSLSTNRVGIGTATPGDTLEITGGDSTGVLISSNGVGANNSYIVFKTDADGTPRRGQIGFDYSSNTVKMVYGDSFDTPNHLCINSAGNVGIGTAAPGSLLTVSSATGSVLELRRDDSAIIAGDFIGSVYFTGDDPTDNTFEPGAQISAVADTNWGNDNHPTNLNFYANSGSDADVITTHLKMVIEGTGNVGIGTATPDYQLEVEKDSDDVYITVSAHSATEAHAPNFIFKKSDGSAASPTAIQDNAVLGIIGFDGCDANDSYAAGAKIIVQADSTWSSSERGTEMLFQTRDANEAIGTAMFIGANKNVGIGTDDPLDKRLNVQTTENVECITAYNSYYNTGANTTTFGVKSDMPTQNRGSGDAHAFYAASATTGGGKAYSFYGSSGIMYNSGFVGIGVTDPDNPLEVKASEGLGIKVSSSHDESILVHLVEEGTAGRIRISDAGTTKVQLEATSGSSSYINNGGNVGIGTASPNVNAILDVTSTTKAFMPPRMTTTQRDAVSSPTAGMVVYNSTTNVLNFHNGSGWGAV